MTPPGLNAVRVGDCVTKVLNWATDPLYPIVFTLEMLSAIMPKAWLCELRPETPENIAP